MVHWLNYLWDYSKTNSAQVISLCALALTIYQAWMTRRHNRLSCRPHLTHWTLTNFQKGWVNISVSNNGLGPAIIRSLQLKIDGQIVKGNDSIVFQNAAAELFPNRVREGNFGHVNREFSLPPDGKVVLAELQFKEPYPTKEEFETALRRAVLKIRYKSFYGTTACLTMKPFPPEVPKRLSFLSRLFRS